MSALLLALALAAADPAATVAIRSGDVYLRSKGQERRVTTGGRALEAAVSSDGRSVAWVQDERTGATGDDKRPTSLWVSGPTGQRKLLASRFDLDVKRNLTEIEHPTFSLDGGYVYVMTEAWATSGAAHQINVKTGVEKFITSANSLSVIRNGPYAGYLLVSQHRYHDAPEFGAYDPVVVVRPDGKEILIVPGSERDDGAKSVDAWLKKTGYKAW